MDEDGAGTGALRSGAGRGLARSARSTLHADAVVAVAGDLVEPAELVDVLVDDGGGRGDGVGRQARGRAGGVARGRDRGGGRGIRRRGVVESDRRDRAAAVGGRVDGRVPERRELVVQPEEGE